MSCNKYAFIFPATKNYLHEARPLVKSLGIHMPDTDLHILTVDGEYRVNPEDFAGLGHKRLFIHDVPEFPAEAYPDLQAAYSFRRIRTSRFLFAAFCGLLRSHSGWESPLTESYDAICLLDADMVVIRPITHIFKMAENGTILVGSNNTLLRYTKKDFDKMQVEVDPAIDVVHPTFCTVPTFVNPSIHKDWLEAIWMNKTGNDLEIPNLLAQSMGLMKQIFHLASQNWLNIHHSMLKPTCYVKNSGDGLYTHLGEPVFSLHGHWNDNDYIHGLLEPMEKAFGWHRPYISTAENAINAIKQEYDKYVS